MTTNTLRGDLFSEKGRELDGTRCTLPTGEVVEVSGRRVPIYDLARKLEERGYGDWRLQAFTPAGTPSLRGLVKAMAGLAVEEHDKRGLRLRKFRAFPGGGRTRGGDQPDLGRSTRGA